MVAEKNRAPLDPERANANLPLLVGATGPQAGKTNAALDAPLQGPRLCRVGGGKSIECLSSIDLGACH
jgi:hypothetical protein